MFFRFEKPVASINYTKMMFETMTVRKLFLAHANARTWFCEISSFICVNRLMLQVVCC